jgi:diguanylate cyclase (GGDEF)-like protein
MTPPLHYIGHAAHPGESTPWPRRWSYPAVGSLLALCAPTGLLALRSLAHRDLPTWTWLLGELRAEALTYTYLAAAAAIAFTFLGRLLGQKEDLLEANAITDALTGLKNRRHLHERLEHELRRATRHRLTLTVLLLDLDRLKDINDRGGHAAGDRAIRAVAESLRTGCRSTDVAARFGGDEFIVLAPETSAADGQALADRIRASLRDLCRSQFAHVPPYTVSIGIADTLQAGYVAEALYNAADRSLYAAKARGGDRALAAPSNRSTLPMRSAVIRKEGRPHAHAETHSRAG